ncbi:CpaF/VirB11 family protein [Turicibacter bilis]|uniref:CpaF/VirB11 family protein n=1 Tax=Turicibacter bilis TaxID=2735723 RepID=UPI001BAFA28D|nr:CpaF/VirB11 family protein [Turicibacter bilis]MBS3199006.1 CpaF family protein [Turicibacter bilis]
MTKKEQEIAQLKLKQLSDLQSNIIKKLHNDQQSELLLGAFGNEEKKEVLSEWISTYLKEHNLNDKYNVQDLVNRLCGLSFLEDILSNENVTDISYNGKDIYVQDNTKGRYKYHQTFTEEEVDILINKISNSINRECNASYPVLDAEYPRLRVNATAKTIAPYGRTFSLRSVRPRLAFDPKKVAYTPQEIFDLLGALVQSKANFVVSGITGSGKTELQKWLIGQIPDNQKIITSEDTLEMFLKELFPKKDIMSYRTTNSFTHTDVVKLALRNNPDWIIIAETRGSEAYSLIKAGQTGHHVITTLHSMSADQSVDRFIHMCKEEYDLDTLLLGKLISNVFSIGIHLEQEVTDQGVQRYISQIVQYENYDQNGVIFSPLYELEYRIVDGEVVKVNKVYPLNDRLTKLLTKHRQIDILNKYSELVRKEQ